MTSNQVIGNDPPSSETLWRKLVGDESPGSSATGANEAPNAIDDPEESAVTLPAAVVYRSPSRPPMALLRALDDGSLDQGDTWRLRKSRTLIGRVSGDIVIPHDPDISAAHAEVVRRAQQGGHQWHLIDLGSTNGTFVRVRQVVLRNGRELILGTRRLTFRNPDVVMGTTSAATRLATPRGTHPQAPAAPAELRRLGPRLTEHSLPGRTAEHPLASPGTAIGRDPDRCRMAFVDDASLDAVHARVVQDPRGRWILKDAGSLNGVWLRIWQIPLDHDAQFLLGGQRFGFQVP